MKRLDREIYNQIIEDLNSKAEEPNKAVEILHKQYEELLCHFPDYEEIILLLNCCIAEDRANRYDDLYPHYKRVDEILAVHGGFGLHEAYKLYYCVGVFSFKFHDYKKATGYFKKCIEDIESQEPCPLKNNYFQNYYICSNILISYALEYNKEDSDCAYKAISHILNSKQLCDIQVEKYYSVSSYEAVKCFFEHNSSDIYNAASEKMQKEIIHMLAHCFSEYAAYLRSNKKLRTAYAWEVLSEKFILFLGSDMVTCTATILAEHGHYYRALNLLWNRHKSLESSEGNGKENEKAEVSFYIYYFSNRIGLDDDNIQKCKNEFLDYAAKAKNQNTELYAWITDFRARFGKNIHNLCVETIEELEGLFRNNFDINTHSYVHPQIQEEERRLQLAFQIIRSYFLVNEDMSDLADNSLFEKCIIFNKKNNEKLGKKDKVVLGENWSKQDSIISFHGLSLCVYGLSYEYIQKLENMFGVSIQISNRNLMGNEKILIFSNSEQVPDFVKSINKSALTYFVFCENSDLEEEVKKRVRDKENYYFFSTLEDTFKVAYIQETIERCHVCAHRWNEYFIMAPITDNSTFAFQSQVIDKYLNIYKEPQREKAIFSDENGYVPNDFVEPRSVEEIDYEILLSQHFDISSWDIFFYFDNWLYKYNPNEKKFVPETFCENDDILMGLLDPLNIPPVKSARRKRECKCPLPLTQCVCAAHTLSEKKDTVENLLMGLSLGLPEKKMNVCTLLFPANSQNGSIDSFMLILSNGPVRSYELRQSFDELVIELQNPGGHSKSKDSISIESTGTLTGRETGKPNIIEEAKVLMYKIKNYLETDGENLSPDEKAKAEQMQEDARNCKDLEECVALTRRWNAFIGVK